jgi:hypothetical protein
MLQTGTRSLKNKKSKKLILPASGTYTILSFFVRLLPMMPKFFAVIFVFFFFLLVLFEGEGGVRTPLVGASSSSSSNGGSGGAGKPRIQVLKEQIGGWSHESTDAIINDQLTIQK